MKVVGVKMDVMLLHALANNSDKKILYLVQYSYRLSLFEFSHSHI